MLTTNQANAGKLRRERAALYGEDSVPPVDDHKDNGRDAERLPDSLSKPNGSRTAPPSENWSTNVRATAL
jgi:hypothetical protein